MTPKSPRVPYLQVLSTTFLLLFCLTGCRSTPTAPEAVTTAAPMRTESPLMPEHKSVYDLMHLEKQHISGWSVGEVHQYQIAVTALEDIDNIIIEERLPNHIEFINATPKTNTQGKSIQWNFRALDKGQTEVIVVNYRPTEEGEFNIRTIVSADPALSTPLFAGMPELSLELLGPEMAEQGEEVTWGLRVTNIGSATASKVFIKDLLPSSLTAQSRLESEIEQLAPGESHEMHIVAVADTRGTFINKATAHMAGNDSIVNASARALKVVKSNLALNQRGPRDANVMSHSEFTLVVRNIGDTTLEHVIVQERIPEEAILRSIEDNGSSMGRTLTWVLDTLEPGQTEEFRFAVSAKKPGTGRFDARVTTRRGLERTHEHSLFWTAQPGLRTSLTDQIDPLRIGEDSVFTATVSNTSRFQAINNATIRIVFGEELRPIATGGEVRGSIRAQEVQYPKLNIEPGDSLKMQIRVQGVKEGVATSVMQIKADFLPKVLSSEEVTTVVK